MNGVIMLPTPDMNTLRRNLAAEDEGRNFTPRSVSGISATITRALKMTGESTAERGVE